MYKSLSQPPLPTGVGEYLYNPFYFTKQRYTIPAAILHWIKEIIHADKTVGGPGFTSFSDIKR